LGRKRIEHFQHYQDGRWVTPFADMRRFYCLDRKDTVAERITVRYKANPPHPSSDKLGGLEYSVKKTLEAQGWRVLRNGWPDFFCFQFETDGTLQFMAVEVKESNDRVSPAQEHMHQALIAARVPVYIIRKPDELRALHRDQWRRWQMREYEPAIRKFREGFVREDEEEWIG
jgi:hypothetical protein